MHSEEWQKIENLCHESLGRKPDERADFLDAACAGDGDLRREVDSLLKYAGLTDDPLDRSTGEGVTRLVGELMEPTLLSGTTIGHYRIETVLGVGGMGHVYRALDMRLGRVVALKFLNGPFFADGAERLVREARAAARLDHPNICSIYEVVEDESRCFIVMQYVEGETLAARIARTPIDVREALDIAAQIANALGEAHARGIVHRDIKPQNIVVTPRGQAKVLDFGLAKSITAMDASKFDAETLKDVPEKWPVAGTVAYMSPEQARGHELDPRTDLFSLAVVLFEVATGLSPFRSTTVPLTLDAILNEPPAAPRQINPTLPPALERIILKGLAKDRELRYQSASELLADLERLRSDPHIGRSTKAAQRARPTRRQLGYGTAGLAIAAVTATFVWSRSAAPPSAAERPLYVQLTNLTDSATSPAVSGDGRMLTYIRGPNTFLDTGQVHVKSLPDGEPVVLTHDDRQKMAPVFSPDGSRIAFTVSMDNTWEIWTVPVRGGEPRLMLANAAALTWFGDRRVLFSEIKRGLQMAVVTRTESRPEIRDVYVPPGMAHRSAVSPDHRWVLVASEMNASGWLPCRLASIDGGPTGRIAGPPAGKCTYAAWSPDGRWMYFSADAGGGFHTWRQRFPDGRPEQITFGATDEEGIAMWPDGRSFVSSVGTTVSSIWIHDAGTERQITSEGYGYFPTFSADGKTLYYLIRVSGQQWAAGQLWAFDLRTGKRERMLPGISMAHYEVSDDGARVVFARTDSGSEGLWIAQVDDHLPPLQVSSDSDTRGFFGPTGTVVFEAREGQGRYIFRVREDGSGRHKVSGNRIVTLASISPDRRWVVAWPSGDDLRRLVAYSLDGSDAVPVCEACSDGDGGPARGHTPPVLKWSPNGQHLYIRLQWLRGSLDEIGKTYVVNLARPNTLPPAFKDETDVTSMPGVQVIPRGGIFPGPHPSLYAYTRTATHRNLYRISVP